MMINGEFDILCAEMTRRRCVVCGEKYEHTWKHGDCTACERVSCEACCGKTHWGIVCDKCWELGCNLCFATLTLCSKCAPKVASRRSERLAARPRVHYA